MRGSSLKFVERIAAQRGPDLRSEVAFLGGAAIADDQVRSLRKRQLIDALTRGERSGACWGVRTNITRYAFPDAIAVPHDKSIAFA